MKVTQHLWFAEDMEAAVRFYTSLVPGSAVRSITPLPAESPSGPAGSVRIADFTLGGQNYMAIQAGPLEPFNHSFSIMVTVDAQEEIDRLWAALGEGGSIEQCGWLKDRWGLSWQIVPSALGTICQLRPQRSLSQPHCSIDPPSPSAAHSRSISSWLSTVTMIEKLWLNGSSGPAWMAM